ncbi:DUF1284 domain-containing protein [archaeon]|jgi:uncharacterized protein|nr:DUF1284 domain-containing protein [archaeon]
MKKPIKIRAHHLNCIPKFYHGGYNEKFAKNMKKICLEIRKNPNQKIQVVIGKFDDLCLECPYKSEKDCVQSKRIGKWVVEQDRKVADYLGVKSGEIFSAKEILNLGMEKINFETISDVCKGCIFLGNCKKVGINNAFRKDLNK